MRFLMLGRHHVGTSRRTCAVTGTSTVTVGRVRVAGIRRSTVHAGLRGHRNELGDDLIDDLLQLVIARQPLKNRHRAATDQREQRRCALHLERLRDRWVACDVDAGQLNLPLELVHRVAERTGHREQTVIGRDPQQQQDRERGGGLHHRLERVLGRVDDIAARGRRSPGLPRLRLHLMLQRFEIHRARE